MARIHADGTEGHWTVTIHADGTVEDPMADESEGRPRSDDDCPKSQEG